MMDFSGAWTAPRRVTPYGGTAPTAPNLNYESGQSPYGGFGSALDASSSTIMPAQTTASQTPEQVAPTRQVSAPTNALSAVINGGDVLSALASDNARNSSAGALRGGIGSIGKMFRL